MKFVPAGMRSKQMTDLNSIISGAGSIAMSGHVRPDGDAVGSTLALYNYIRKVWPEKEVTVYLEDPAEIFSYLKGFSDVTWPEKDAPDKEYDLFIALDLGDLDRLGNCGKYFLSAKKRICIDHHISNSGFGDEYHIVPEASSTSELVFDLIDDSMLDEDIAKCIYTGIIHDTGIMQYSNTSRHTLEIVGRLIEFGFDFTEIINKTFYEKTYVQNQIMGRAVLESILFMNGRCIASVIDHKVMEFYGATSKDFDGIANQLFKTRGVDCAIFMYESSHEQLLYKVSMRASDRVNVADIAKKFGGGGHRKAAGFSMSGTYHDILNNISAEIEKQLESNE